MVPADILQPDACILWPIFHSTEVVCNQIAPNLQHTPSREHKKASSLTREIKMRAINPK